MKVTHTRCASSDDTNAMVENATRIAIVSTVESVPNSVLSRDDVSTNFCMVIKRRELRAVPVPSVRRSFVTDSPRKSDDGAVQRRAEFAWQAHCGQSSQARTYLLHRRPSYRRGHGGIGRRTALRWQRGDPWKFES